MSETATNPTETGGQVHPIVMPSFGATVTVSITLVRRYRSELSPGRFGGTYNKQRKLWEEKAITPRSGILIGYRNLSNGTREWESEVGYIYTPEEHFRAALVVFSDRENPVYAPISALA